MAAIFSPLQPTANLLGSKFRVSKGDKNALPGTGLWHFIKKFKKPPDYLFAA